MDERFNLNRPPKRTGGTPQRPTRRPMYPSDPPSESPRDQSASGLYVPWWGFVLVVLMVAAATCGLWGYVLFSRADSAVFIGSTPTPMVLFITPTPTLYIEPIASTPQVVATPDPGSQEPTPTSPSDTIPLGSTVMVTGTEGAGLALRQGPGVSYSWMAIGNEGELFLVQDGPRENDGYVWWFIADPQNPDRVGWAAGDFLVMVEP